MPIAFISGILTVFSPCVLPILPAVLASGIDGNTRRIKGVIIGLVISFTIASLFLATLVRVLGIPADTVRTLAVVLLAIFGLSLVFSIIWEKVQIWIERYWHFQPIQNQTGGFWGGFLTGTSLGIVWTPCIGPVVAAMATLAAVSSFSLTMVLIVFAYALGAGVPLYFIAKGGSAASQKLAFFKTESQKIRQIFGIIILATALFIWTGADRVLQAWTLATLPESWTQIATTFESRFKIDTQPNQQMPKVKPGETVVRKTSLQNDFTGAKVKPEDLLQGCFGQDCIPSIENPKFESSEQASWLKDEDTVFAIDYKGVQRVYPQRILNWHEIVNDVIAGDPIAVTFCPLCGSALAFERKVSGVITEFGVSGKLHNSDLVMYDRYEGNLWQQITGAGIVGPSARRNETLKQVPIITTTWGEWKKEHPSTGVLSRNTGFSRNYDQHPYGTYEQDDQLLFGVKGLDKSLQIKTVVYGIEIDGNSKAYPESVFDEKKVIEDTVGNVAIRLERTQSGQIKVTNLQTNEEIIPIRLFWFAWAAFHPDTKLYIKSVDKNFQRVYYLNNRSSTMIKYNQIKRELKNRKKLIACAQQLGVVGDATRLKICYLLCHYPEVSVGEMAEILDASISVVSHSVKKLLDLGMVERRKETQTVYYSLKNCEFTKTLKDFIT
ncbi:metalloregulator ArsR/SmtB family transcription factor [Candidatus Daviesbacteria bacterium]|nr:metalloregulator ArsR/SmtB family transcription factor [Candidatus Daviesbacteria bacterium]